MEIEVMVDTGASYSVAPTRLSVAPVHMRLAPLTSAWL